MKEQIYTLLNEMDNQADSYESSQVSELELKKWKKQFSCPPYQAPQPCKICCRRSRCRMYHGNHSVLSATQTLVYAGMKSVTYNLSQLLGIQKDLSPYHTVCGRYHGEERTDLP